MLFRRAAATRGPGGGGVDRGLGTASARSSGRSESGLGTASERSGGRSDAGLERARLRRENAQRAQAELSDRPHMAARLQTTAADLRAGYEQALGLNPELKFGEYVAATRLAANLGDRYPAVTRAAILSGLAGGSSIGQTIRELGVGEREAKEARKRAEREVKAARRN